MIVFFKSGHLWEREIFQGSFCDNKPSNNGFSPAVFSVFCLSLWKMVPSPEKLNTFFNLKKWNSQNFGRLLSPYLCTKRELILNKQHLKSSNFLRKPTITIRFGKRQLLKGLGVQLCLTMVRKTLTVSHFLSKQ